MHIKNILKTEYSSSGFSKNDLLKNTFIGNMNIFSELKTLIENKNIENS